MTVTLSQQDYWERIYPESQIPQTLSEFDRTWNYCDEIGVGYYRDIQIRDGVNLAIAQDYFHEDLQVKMPERSHSLELSYTLTGTAQSSLDSAGAGQYAFCGSGMAPSETLHVNAHQQYLTVAMHIEPTVFCQWVPGQVPDGIKHWMKESDQRYYTQVCQTTVAMQTVLQQILHCPFQELAQQMYLEGKLWELVALHLTQALNANAIPEPKLLRSEDIEQIHYAKELLVARLEHPPSLMELARLAGINDHKLKVGFRACFGTTVFGYLHDYRMERSRQLLESGDLNIAEAARQVGFVNRSHFAIAFRKKFGVNPREYRQSVLNHKVS
jgi:AraC-like DNA-binding protein